MEVLRQHADPRIRRFVRSFTERQATLGESVVTAPLPARPDQFIEFYLQDRYRVSHDDAPPEFAPEFVVVGPQSYRSTRLFLSGSLQVFTIRFQPGGFHALFGVPMPQLVDEGIAARDVLGAMASGLRDAVLCARSFPERAEAAQRWIMARADQVPPVDRIARLAELIERAHGRLRIEALARYAGLSDRQFTRRFEAQVGLQPKLFQRTVRFNAVLTAKANAPDAAWGPLVHEAGYADQSHFIRDCHALAGGPPKAFFAEWVKGR